MELSTQLETDDAVELKRCAGSSSSSSRAPPSARATDFCDVAHSAPRVGDQGHDEGRARRQLSAAVQTGAARNRDDGAGLLLDGRQPQVGARRVRSLRFLTAAPAARMRPPTPLTKVRATAAARISPLTSLVVAAQRPTRPSPATTSAATLSSSANRQSAVRVPSSPPPPPSLTGAAAAGSAAAAAAAAHRRRRPQRAAGARRRRRCARARPPTSPLKTLVGAVSLPRDKSPVPDRAPPIGRSRTVSALATGGAQTANLPLVNANSARSSSHEPRTSARGATPDRGMGRAWWAARAGCTHLNLDDCAKRYRLSFVSQVPDRLASLSRVVLRRLRGA